MPYEMHGHDSRENVLVCFQVLPAQTTPFHPTGSLGSRLSCISCFWRGFWRSLDLRRRFQSRSASHVLDDVNHVVSLHILLQKESGGVFGVGENRMTVSKVQNQTNLTHEVHANEDRDQHSFRKPVLLRFRRVRQSIHRKTRRTSMRTLKACPHLPLPYRK